VRASRDGGDPQFIGTAVTGPDGSFAIASGPLDGGTWFFEASWAGDDRHGPRSEQGALTSVPRFNPGLSFRLSQRRITVGETVRVRVAIAIAQAGAYASRGGERLFRYRKSCFTSGRRCPAFGAGVAPNHAGRAVTFTVQRRTARGWRLDGTLSVGLSRRSTVAILFRYGPARAIVGKRYRIKASIPSHADHLGAQTDWLAFRVTR
jgi:hypothetical protein